MRSQIFLSAKRHELGSQRVLGDFIRDEYMAARAGKLAELEQELGGADYPLEAVLTRINRMGDILRDGTRKQQKRAINLLFDKILVGPMTKIKGVELQNWAQSLFADLLMVSGDMCAPRDLERTPCRQPWQGSNPLNPIVPQPTKTARLRQRKSWLRTCQMTHDASCKLSPPSNP